MEQKRKFLVGGNWKSNNTHAESEKLVNEVLNKIEFDTSKVEVVVAPVFIHIPWVLANVQKNILVSAQNCSLTGYGAYTGEITGEHVKDLGLHWVILGHSERRQYFGEDDKVVADKVQRAVGLGLNVMACIGERLPEREAGQTMTVLKTQLDALKAKLKEEDWAKVAIAYEPVWAIGTGKVASPEQAQEAHEFIRKYLEENVSKAVAHATRILYGGSVNGKNSAGLIIQKDIDGFLVGGASLKPEFADIVKSCVEVKKD